MKTNLKELHYGEDVTIEQAQGLFFDQDALIIQPRPVYRMDHKGRRFYFTQDKEGNNTFYISVTTFISMSLPQSVHLIKWYAEHGYDKAKAMAQEAADYGTLMHIEAATMMINKTYDLEAVGTLVSNYVRELGYSPRLVRPWAEKLKKDLLAFAQFAIDVNLQPVAIECILADEELGLAGAIDLVAHMDVTETGFWGETYKTGPRAGEPKATKRTIRVLAIVDLKSGRKGFYESHELQVEAYGRMWNSFFKENQVARIFNWSPKDWRGEKPSYNLKDQTDGAKAAKLDNMLAIAKIEAASREQVATVPRGVIDLKNDSLLANIRVMTMDEIVKESVAEMEKKTAPDGVFDDFDKGLNLEENE